MGNFFSDLGKTFMGSDSETETITSPTKTKRQLELIDIINKQAKNQVGKGIDGYTGDLSASETGLQQKSFGNLEQLLSQGGNISPEAAGSYGVDENAVKSYWQDSVADPMIKNWESEAVPEIQELYAGMNAEESGSLNRALTGSRADLQGDLGSTLAQMLFGEKQAAADRQFAANESFAGRDLEAQGMNAELEQALTQLGMTGGEMQRQIQNEGLASDYDLWNQKQAYNNPWLKLLGPALGTESMQVDTVVKPGSAGILGGVLGGIGQGWASNGFSFGSK